VPQSSKAYCVRHMCKNCIAVFRNKRLKVLLWEIVNTYPNSKFNKCMSEIKTTNFEFYEKLNLIRFKTFFPVPRYCKTTFNPMESKKSIALDITNLIISINNYAMKLFYDKKQKVFQL